MPHPLRRSAYALTATALAYTSQAAAQPELTVIYDPIDQAYYDCTAADSSTAGELACIQQAHINWDKALNQSYQALLKILPKAQKAALQQAQREWLAFRNVEWESLDKRYAAKDGAIYRVFHAVKRMELTKQRALQLHEYQSLFND